MPNLGVSIASMHVWRGGPEVEHNMTMTNCPDAKFGSEQPGTFGAVFVEC